VEPSWFPEQGIPASRFATDEYGAGGGDYSAGGSGSSSMLGSLLSLLLPWRWLLTAAIAEPTVPLPPNAAKAVLLGQVEFYTPMRGVAYLLHHWFWASAGVTIGVLATSFSVCGLACLVGLRWCCFGRGFGVGIPFPSAISDGLEGLLRPPRQRRDTARELEQQGAAEMAASVAAGKAVLGSVAALIPRRWRRGGRGGGDSVGGGGASERQRQNGSNAGSSAHNGPSGRSRGAPAKRHGADAEEEEDAAEVPLEDEEAEHEWDTLHASPARGAPAASSAAAAYGGLSSFHARRGITGPAAGAANSLRSGVGAVAGSGADAGRSRSPLHRGDPGSTGLQFYPSVSLAESAAQSAASAPAVEEDGGLHDQPASPGRPGASAVTSMRQYVAQSAALRAAASAVPTGAPVLERHGQGAPAVFGAIRNRSQGEVVQDMAAHAVSSGVTEQALRSSASETTLSAVEARERSTSDDGGGGSSKDEEPALE